MYSLKVEEHYFLKCDEAKVEDVKIWKWMVISLFISLEMMDDLTRTISSTRKVMLYYKDKI